MRFNISGMLNFQYQKSSTEIIQKAAEKIGDLNKKIIERQGRIDKICLEHGIDDKAMIEILEKVRSNQTSIAYSKMSSSVSNLVRPGTDPMPGREDATIAAGTIQNLLHEKDMIADEKKAIDKLNVIIRNLKDLPNNSITVVPANGVIPTCMHQLSHEELIFLGF